MGGPDTAMARPSNAGNPGSVAHRVERSLSTAASTCLAPSPELPDPDARPGSVPSVALFSAGFAGAAALGCFGPQFGDALRGQRARQVLVHDSSFGGAPSFRA